MGCRKRCVLWGRFFLPDDRLLEKLKNIGPKTAERLALVGLNTIGGLREVGAVEAYVRLKKLNPEFISVVGLYAMQAGLMDLHWLHLPQEIKQTVIKEAQSML